jgi:hypothetical protein
MSEKLYAERNKRIQDAVALREPDQMPVAPTISGLPFFIYGKGSQKDLYYNPEVCEEPIIRYHEEFKPDLQSGPVPTPGLANEIAETSMIDWPGRPGSIVNPLSTYQVHEREFMRADEYDELLKDYTGFLINKYIPRAFPGLKGFENFRLTTNFLGTGIFNNVFASPVTDAFAKITRMAEANRRITESQARIEKTLTEKGFPPMFAGMGQAPFDVISDYFRGTAGMFEDQIECPEKIAEACELFVDLQIAGWQYLHYDMPVKRVFFPLHKGLDGFMSPRQFDELYWRPLQKILAALIDMGATPVLFTEGPYESRISYIAERLSELKKGSCIVQFSKGDFAALKKTFQGITCISGGMPVYTLEYGTKEEVADRVKYLVDNCAAGGGYILDIDLALENAKYENIVQMYETARSYGKK